METLLNFLNTFGIHVDESTPDIVLLAGYYLVTTGLIFINAINISFYLLSIYIVSNEKLLSKIPEEYAFVHKFLKFYKNIRVGYIIFEAILFYFLLSVMFL